MKMRHPFLDKQVPAGRAVSSALTVRPGGSAFATFVDWENEERSLARVTYGADDNEVVAPVAGGLYGPGDLCPVTLDGDGRVATVLAPILESPDGDDERVPVGQLGQLLRDSTDFQDQFAGFDPVVAVQETQEALEKALDAKGRADAAFTMVENAVTGTRLEYAVAGRDSAPTSGWSSSYPAVVSAGQFVWRRTIVSYGDNPEQVLPAERLTGDSGGPGAGVESMTAFFKLADAAGVVTTVATNLADDPRCFLMVGATSSYLVDADAAYPVAAPTGRTRGTAMWRSGTGGYLANHRNVAGLTSQEWQVARKGGFWAYSTVAVGSFILANQGLPNSAIPANQWKWVPFDIVGSGSNAHTLAASASATTSDRLYIDGFLVTDSVDTPYFDGGYAPSGYGSAWNGDPNASTSRLTITTFEMPTPTTNPPSGDWSTSVPALVEGKKLWRTDLTVLTDNSWFYSTPTVQPISNGKDGAPGTPGVSVTGVKPFYALVASGSPATPGDVGSPPAPWVDVMPAYDGSKTQWSTNRISYSDGHYQYTPPVRDEAYGVAAQALVAADGKSKNWYGPNAPTVAQGVRAGDSWFNGAKWQTVESVSGDTVSWRDMTPGAGYVDRLNLGSGTVGNLEVGRLAAVSSEFDVSVVQKLIANAVFAKTFAANSVLVSPGNLLPDPNMKDPAFWNGSTYVNQSGGKIVGQKCYVSPSTSGNAYLGTSSGIVGSTYPVNLSPAVREGTAYHVSAWAKTDATSSTSPVKLQVKGAWYNENGTQVGVTFTIAEVSAITAGVWQELVGDTPKCPSGASRLGVQFIKTSAWTGIITWSSPSVVAMVGGVLILDGEIEAPKIKASEDLSAKIGQFLKVTAEMLEATAVDGKTITGATIQTTSAPNQGIKLDTADGFRAYDSGGNLGVQISPGIKNGIAIRSPGGAMLPLSDAAFGTHVSAETASLSYTVSSASSHAWTRHGTDNLAVTFTAWGTKAVIDWSQQWGINRGTFNTSQAFVMNRVVVNNVPLQASNTGVIGARASVYAASTSEDPALAQSYPAGSTVMNTTPGQTYTVVLQFRWWVPGNVGGEAQSTTVALANRMIRVQQVP